MNLTFAFIPDQPDYPRHREEESEMPAAGDGEDNEYSETAAENNRRDRI